MQLQLQHKSFPTADFKVLDEDQGIVEAYVSVFGVTDHANERVRFGFFKKSLEKKLPKVVWAHKWDQPIGKTIEAEEVPPGDHRLPESIKAYGGLRARMRMNLETTRGKEAFSDLKFGAVDEFSFGYTTTDSLRMKDGVIDLIEGDTYELSPVLVGCNPLTLPTSIKDASGAKAYFSPAIQPSMTWAALNSLNDYLFWTVTWECLFGEGAAEPLSDRMAKLTDALGEYSRLFLGAVSALMEGVDGDDDAKAELEAEFKAIFSPPARIAGRLADQLAAVLDAAADITERHEKILALRQSEGRSFPSERWDQLAGLKSRLETLLSARVTEKRSGLDATLLQLQAEFEATRLRTLLALGGA